MDNFEVFWKIVISSDQDWHHHFLNKAGLGLDFMLTYGVLFYTLSRVNSAVNMKSEEFVCSENLEEFKQSFKQPTH